MLVISLKLYILWNQFHFPSVYHYRSISIVLSCNSPDYLLMSELMQWQAHAVAGSCSDRLMEWQALHRRDDCCLVGSLGSVAVLCTVGTTAVWSAV